MAVNSDLSERFPSTTLMWPGSLLGSIAHAIFVAQAPFMAHEQSWDGQNYNVQDSEGSRGTIAFGDGKTRFVGVFYLESSERSLPKQTVHDATNTATILRGMPDQLKSLSQQALQYVLQDVSGQKIPVITAAFWSDLSDSQLTASEPWADVVKNGAVLVKKQMQPVGVAIKQWADDFEFTAAQTSFVDKLFKRRVAATSSVVTLTPPEAKQVRGMADGDEGFDACRESLSEVGIILP